MQEKYIQEKYIQEKYIQERNIGGTIKSVVAIICGIGIVVFLIAGIALISQGFSAVGWIVMLAGILSMAVGALFLYGFGELVEKTSENNAALLRMEKELAVLKALERQKHGQTSGGETVQADAKKNSGTKAQAEKVSPKAPSGKAGERASGAPQADTASSVPGRVSFDEASMRAMEAMESAAEIYDYCSEILDGGDENVRELLKILNSTASAERLYGKAPKDALLAIRNYVKHGNRVFAVDRSDSLLTCPVCGKQMMSSRNRCLSCGALLRS